jgi:hypothetical protein
MSIRRSRIGALALGLALCGSGGCRSLGLLLHRQVAQPVAPFDTLEVSGPVVVEVAAGDRPALTVEGAGEEVSSRVEEGTLFLEGKTADGGAPVSVRLTVPQLRRLVVAASTAKVTGGIGPDLDIAARRGASVTVANIEGGHVVVDGRGHSRITLAGTADTVAFSLFDDSRADGRQLKVGTAKVALAGASRLDLRPEKAVAGEATGHSRLEVWSKPRRLKVATRGAASVEYVR